MVLAAERRPLRPKEIIQRGYASEVLPWHLHGNRQDKTLHARLSEDIARSPEKSRFYRTAPGVFYLRQLREDPETPAAYREVYLAPPRRKELNRDKVFSIRLCDVAADVASGEISMPVLQRVLGSGAYAYRSFLEIKESQDVAIVHSFVVVYKNDRVLSFRCGKFFPESDPLYGRRSIGIGGAVLPDNVDLLYDSMYGILENGIDELGYGIGLPQRLAERARYNSELSPHLAILVTDTNAAPAVIHVVIAYHCPDEFEPSKAALSVNDLKWIDANQPGNDLQDYDRTSRVLFENRHLSRMMHRQVGA